MSQPLIVKPIILFGPTATGKTAAAVYLAETFASHRFELVSADSRQIYREFDIGTAKPDHSEREAIPHHLIDVVEGDETFDVGKFVNECDAVVNMLSQRGVIPVIAGGTAFYLQRYLFGLPETPVASQEIRETLEERLEHEGLAALRRTLREVDPVSEERISRNDRYRVLRALEVYESTGVPLSQFDVPQRIRRHIQPLIIGLYRDRTDLYQRINKRVHRMMAAGLAGEVERLLAQGHTTDEPAFRSIGYREFLEVGSGPPWSEDDLSVIEAAIARNTRRYAKRQVLFFRRIPGVRWIHADDTVALENEVRYWIAENPDP